MKTLMQPISAIFCVSLALANDAALALGSRQVFFPSPTPEIVQLTATESPRWLNDQIGDDGYLKVEVATSMRNGCIPLGSAGLLGQVLTSEMQLTISVRLLNIASPFQGREVPIAIVDGRSNPGGCLPITLLDAGMVLVPLARLERPTAGVGNPRIELLVRSTRSNRANIVGPAQAILGVATVFATGGAATAVSGLTSALAQPAFKQLESTWNSAASGVTPGISGSTYDWRTLRTTRKISFPIFVGELKAFEDDAQGIPRLQTDPNSRKAVAAIDLVFSHYPTAFDIRTDQQSGVPFVSEIPPTSILGYPNQAGVPTLGQLIDGELTSLGKAGDVSAIRNSCEQLVDRAKRAGFSLRDRSIILYFALSRSRPADWYQKDFAPCTQGLVAEAKIIRDMWGSEQPVFRFLDARRSFPDETTYDKWYENSVPILENLRKALVEPRLAERERLLKRLSGGLDIVVDADSEVWPPIVSSEAKEPFPNLRQLAAKPLKGAGCFHYQPPFSASRLGHFLLLDSADRVWLISPTRASGDDSRIASVEISMLDDGWRSFYADLFRGNYFDNPVRGGCAQLRSKFR